MRVRMRMRMRMLLLLRVAYAYAYAGAPSATASVRARTASACGDRVPVSEQAAPPPLSRIRGEQAAAPAGGLAAPYTTR